MFVSCFPFLFFTSIFSTSFFSLFCTAVSVKTSVAVTGRKSTVWCSGVVRQ